MLLVIKFYFTSSTLNMFWTLVHPSFTLMLKTSIFTEHTTIVVIQQKSRRLLMMDVLNVRNMLSIEEVK